MSCDCTFTNPIQLGNLQESLVSLRRECAPQLLLHQCRPQKVGAPSQYDKILGRGRKCPMLWSTLLYEGSREESIGVFPLTFHHH